MSFVIAIDGPSGAGKGYLASQLAKKYNMLYIDTGAMYRAFGVYCIEKSIDILDEIKVAKAMDEANIYFENDIVYINGNEYESKIRTEQVGMYASNVSKIVYVRKKMVELQRKMAQKLDVIMEGRDIGSVVFPNADIKVYLTASVIERARRRQKDLQKKGIDLQLDEVIEEIEKRDLSDITKKISPLIKCIDAIEIDTTVLSKEQVVDAVGKLIDERKKVINGKLF